MFHNVIDEKVTEHCYRIINMGVSRGGQEGGGANADVTCSCLVKYPIFFDRAFGAHIKYNFASARKRIFFVDLHKMHFVLAKISKNQF